MPSCRRCSAWLTRRSAAGRAKNPPETGRVPGVKPAGDLRLITVRRDRLRSLLKSGTMEDMEVSATARPRGKRFHRSEAPRPMQLTARDLALLAQVARHRFLSSAHLSALDGGSPQNVLRSLRLLFDHGYLDRPEGYATVLDRRPRPFVYGLGTRGARALREHGHLVNDGTDWTEKNKRAGAVYIEHTLEIADFMTSLEVAVQARHGIGLLRERELIAAAPEETRRSRVPLRWAIARMERGRPVVSAVVPDGLFGLTYPDGTAAYFLLEIDRGTIRNPADQRARLGCLAQEHPFQARHLLPGMADGPPC